ncbi:hypothetical protein [Dendronalium sp. ChiSLP03b]|uniref:hypothetical protein n=1 Tax=Dendronalium sp. ChiSLP03b TaxID=3075381 RepID=UPI0039196A2C
MSLRLLHFVRNDNCLTGHDMRCKGVGENHNADLTFHGMWKVRQFSGLLETQISWSARTSTLVFIN